MRDEFVRYAHRLESLSISELSQGAEKLVSSERRYTAALIAHLAEISRRKGHLELGFKSRSLENSSGRGEEARCWISRLPGATGSAGVSPASCSVHSEFSAGASTGRCGLPV